MKVGVSDLDFEYESPETKGFRWMRGGRNADEFMINPYLWSKSKYMMTGGRTAYQYNYDKLKTGTPRLESGRLVNGVDAKEYPMVVDGTNFKIGEVPYQVLLKTLGSNYICGGSIINRLFILTANHCNVHDWMKTDKNTDYPYPSNILGIVFKVYFITYNIILPIYIQLDKNF